jgi:hypothetical protein
MGNLPRSRPGRRSQKRDSGSGSKRTATGSKRTAAKATARSKPHAAAAAKQAKPAAAEPREPRKAEPVAADQRDRPRDPVSEAVRLAGEVAGVGFKVAGGILRRLPRP